MLDIQKPSIFEPAFEFRTWSRFYAGFSGRGEELVICFLACAVFLNAVVGGAPFEVEVDKFSISSWRGESGARALR